MSFVSNNQSVQILMWMFASVSSSLMFVVFRSPPRVELQISLSVQENLGLFLVLISSAVASESRLHLAQPGQAPEDKCLSSESLSIGLTP